MPSWLPLPQVLVLQRDLSKRVSWQVRAPRCAVGELVAAAADVLTCGRGRACEQQNLERKLVRLRVERDELFEALRSIEVSACVLA